MHGITGNDVVLKSPIVKRYIQIMRFHKINVRQQSILFGVKRMKSKYMILVLSTFSLLFGCQAREPTAIPDELLGVWKTPAPKYKRCFFEITKDSIIFVNRDSLEGPDVNIIVKIEKTKKEKQTLYTIHYKRMKGEEYKFPFHYDISKGGTIRFKNQKEIAWRKVNARSIEGFFMNSD